VTHTINPFDLFMFKYDSINNLQALFNFHSMDYSNENHSFNKEDNIFIRKQVIASQVRSYKMNEFAFIALIEELSYKY